MASVEQTRPLTNAVPSHVRGDRLDPPRSSRVYWHLTSLRDELEAVIQEYVASPNGQLLVDFGCGNMPYRPLFLDHVERYVGVDLPGNELADRIMEHPNGSPIETASADIVLSSQVLEHVGSPVDYLNESHRMLRDDGLLILSTHGVWRYHPDPVDYWRWTSAGLRKSIEAQGFEVVAMRGVMGPAATGLQIWQDAVSPRIRGFFRKVFIRFMQHAIQRADRKTPEAERNADASVYVVVARRKDRDASSREA